MTTAQPFFSIITASLNNAATLNDTLHSIATQRFASVEHVVVDGGSRDHTLSILESYRDKYRLRWISEPDGGISDALNKGIQLSTGKYLLVIQADDFLVNEDVLTRAYTLLCDEQFDIVSYPVYVVYENGTKVLYKPRKYTNIRYHFKNIFPHQGTFVHKRVYDSVGLFRTELRISMDYDFFYRCMEAKRTFCKETMPIAVWRAEGVSHTQKYTRIRYEMRVQDLNETSNWWRVAQRLFRMFYLPYRRLHSAVSEMGRSS